VDKFIDKNYIIENLEKVINDKDEVIIFYIGIWTFIRYLNINSVNLAEEFIKIIEEFLGEKKTIILPSFTANEFVKTKKFDIKLSIPKESGVVPTSALKSGNYFRTRQPLHSYLVKGPLTNEIKKLSLDTSWGNGSVLSWLSKKNARICVIGIPWKIGCSYFHRFEELYQVPWRYYKKFHGKLYNNNKLLGDITENKFAGPLSIKFRYDYYPVEKLMNENNIILKGKNNIFSIQSSLVSDIDIICENFFEKDPWQIIVEKNNVRSWIKEVKENEKNIKF